MNKFDKFFSDKAGQFQEHIESSIPMYSEMQKDVLRYTTGKTVLDIGASEGNFAMDCINAGALHCTALEPCLNMRKTILLNAIDRMISDDKLSIDNDLFTNNYLADSSTEFDVITEMMTFQFIDEKREDKILNVKRLLKDDGVFLSAEKFLNKDWNKNEETKDEYKRESFSNEEMKDKSDSILGDMTKNLYDRDEYEKLLSKHFHSVIEIWRSGNFSCFEARHKK